MKNSDHFTIWLGEHSPYLYRLADHYPELLGNDADEQYSALQTHLNHYKAKNQQGLMQELRIAKNKIALLVALADIRGQWDLQKVTNTLSHFAELALSKTIDFLLHEGAARGEITLADKEYAQRESGIVVLGMGKLGAGELNYSSDIDLIILFERGKLNYKGRRSEQHFMNKLAQDIVTIMQERTADSYVFRTDLRLRPDPASTPPAINTEAAYYYYESVGQNWERAAMIKAKPVAGDLVAGEQFLKTLVPYIWRKNLDFAAINDIHSIKRQMDSRQNKSIELLGHNIKLGLGGIREIEFFAQIHQLIWGGRKPILRSRPTLVTLEGLVSEGLIDPDKQKVLHVAYEYLRKLEHRLQMVADEQTHTMPKDEQGFQKIAHFMGYDTVEPFKKELFAHLKAVNNIYKNSFKSATDLGDEGSLVFTGVSHDPDTLETLSAMGFVQPETVSEIVMGWHHGTKRSTRTKRARELITELMPAILRRLSETANPDAAFLKFNDFLTHLPAGVQLFSLFSANPKLLKLIADIMGSAPRLADTLSKSPELIDGVLFSDFYDTLPDKTLLLSGAKERLEYAADTEEALDFLTRFRDEKQFQAGVQLLRHKITAEQSAIFLSELADVTLQLVVEHTASEFEKTYGKILGAEFAIIGLGKLGSLEMTFSSDLDLVFIYDVSDFDAISDGEKGFTASVYYNRLAQRIVHALTALNPAGKLYEVDTRLRPSGKQGLLAVSTKALNHYFEELAWTFEFMAFTKARACAGDQPLKLRLDHFISNIMQQPRNAETLRNDVAKMREKMREAYATTDRWNVKHIKGGLVDLDFLAQYWILLYAPTHPDMPTGCASQVFRWLDEKKLVDTINVQKAHYFMNQLFNMLRLTVNGEFKEITALPGLITLLTETVKAVDFEQLKNELLALEIQVYDTYMAVIGHHIKE